MSPTFSRRALLPLAGALLIAPSAMAQPARLAVDFAIPEFGGLPPGD